MLRLRSRKLAEDAIDCLLEAGYGTVELTLTTPDAVEIIRALRRRMPAGFLVGAGTVLDLETARACLEAGADYLVSPGYVGGLVDLAHSRATPCLLGAFTPTEVMLARHQGADVIKIFPAASGGPSHVSALHAVFPDVALCPTGGVSLDNMHAYFEAGAAMVGIGNNIVDLKALEAGDRAAVIAHAARFLGRYQA